MSKNKFACSVLATCKQIDLTFNKYKDFFSCFFNTDILPDNSFRLQNKRRRTVVISDTDSICFRISI